MVVVVPLFFFAFADDVVCAPPKDPAIRNALIQKLAANFKYFVIDVLSQTRSRLQYLSSTPTLAHPVDTTSASELATAPPLCYKRYIPVCFGRFEFHAEWLRDEPFDATTTGQNKGVPVSTLSWKATRPQGT
jgi:hypothetical protein